MKIEEAIKSAEQQCKESGSRLTIKRKSVLEVLLISDKPLSAYELADQYQARYNESIPAMSVYRMLDFLIEEQLVHKLSSANKYVACSHISCDHSHDIPQFLICNKCQMVKEVRIEAGTIHSLNQSVENVGFHLNSPQLELYGCCQSCQDVVKNDAA